MGNKSKNVKGSKKVLPFPKTVVPARAREEITFTREEERGEWKLHAVMMNERRVKK